MAQHLTGVVETFDAGFRALTGHKPFRWQRRLFADYFVHSRVPASLDLPTGLGKTAVMAIWYLARQAGASALPRRLVYVVDRRAVVDQATEEAEKIRANAHDASLCISTLRGRFVDNKEWLEDPAAVAIIIGTVDMIGSRLLFEGYGVSRRMRPYHAGLLGADTLLVLDESHLVPPFERLLEQIASRAELGPRSEADRRIVPRFHLLPLSATGRARDGEVFRLTDEDREEAIVRQRLSAAKHLGIAPTGGGKLEECLAATAWELAGKNTSPVRVLVYCNSRTTAEKTNQEIEKLAKKAKVEIERELLVGARRVKEREDAKERLKALGFFSGGAKPERPAFVIATSAGEVGIDLDADHAVMDLVPFERMVQRLGRVNRLGRGDARIIVTDEVDGKLSEALKPGAEQCRGLLQELPRHADGSHDASPGALMALRQTHGRFIGPASTPEPLYPALTRPLVDAWSMTSLAEHTGRPEVQPWLRGWVEDEPPRTTLIWRKNLPVRFEAWDEATKGEISEFFAAAPPHLAEMLETETFRVCDWMLTRAKKLQEVPESGRDGVIEAGDVSPVSPGSTVCLALARSGETIRCYTVADLVAVGNDRKRMERAFAEATLVLDARLGGLTDGLLDEKGDISAVSAADGENGWLEPTAEVPVVPFRVRRVSTGKEDEAKSEDAADRKWLAVHAFDLERDADDNPRVQLVVEKWRGDAPDEDARSVASRAQTLQQHQEWVADKAGKLVAALGLTNGMGKALVLAGQLHDEGKKAERWQNAFHTPRHDRPYGKTASKRPPNFYVLGGYRHEFGSLSHVEKSNEFGALPDDLKDLVLHLVAAHHGRARPVIETDGCEDGPPTLLEARARDVALRFARLQKRFGPWGLAWLEALLRAADQQASRDLEDGKARDGRN